MFCKVRESVPRSFSPSCHKSPHTVAASSTSTLLVGGLPRAGVPSSACDGEPRVSLDAWVGALEALQGIGTFVCERTSDMVGDERAGDTLREEGQAAPDQDLPDCSKTIAPIKTLPNNNVLPQLTSDAFCF